MSIHVAAPGTPTHGTSSYWIGVAQPRGHRYTQATTQQTWTSKP
jgi:hypothetical protein